MNVYESLKGNIDSFVLSLRRMGYTAYVEQDGAAVLLVTDYNVTGCGFQYVGRR
jgi:hypothetical protein